MPRMDAMLHAVTARLLIASTCGWLLACDAAAQDAAVIDAPARGGGRGRAQRGAAAVAASRTGVAGRASLAVGRARSARPARARAPEHPQRSSRSRAARTGPGRSPHCVAAVDRPGHRAECIARLARGALEPRAPGRAGGPLVRTPWRGERGYQGDPGSSHARPRASRGPRYPASSRAREAGLRLQRLRRAGGRDRGASPECRERAQTPRRA